MRIRRLLIATTTITAIALMAWSAMAAQLGAREARFVGQGYGTQTPAATVTPGPSPTPTATPRPFGFTPRPTSTGLAPRPATPTPRPVAATPGPCTIALSERSAVCKTAYYQPVTWTLRITTTAADQRVVTSSVFDGTSRVVFTPALAGGSIITIAPRWQAARVISVITLTGAISGTHIVGLAPAQSVLSIRFYRHITRTNFYNVWFYTTTVGASGQYTFAIPWGRPLLSPRDYWQVWHYSSGRQTGDVDTVVGVLTRRLYLPVVSR